MVTRSTDSASLSTWRWAHAALQRLREKRASLAEETFEIRQVELTSLTRLLMSELPDGARGEGLAVLKGLLKSSGAPQGNRVSAERTEEINPLSFVDLFKRHLTESSRESLSQLAPLIYDSKTLRELLSSMLHPVENSHGSSEGAAQSIAKVFGLTAESVSSERAQKMSALLAHRLTSIDNKFWSFLKLFSEQAKVDLPPKALLKDRIRSYLSGDPENPIGVVENRIAETEKFVSAILAAIMQAWKTSHAEMEKELAPASIKERTSLNVFQKNFPLRESIWWDVYEKRHKETGEDARFVKFLNIFVRRTVELAQKA